MEDSFHAQFFQTEPEVSMADLARLCQKPDEKATQFINRFKWARTKCKIILPEPEFVEFRDSMELTARVSRYEALLEEESERNASSLKT